MRTFSRILGVAAVAAIVGLMPACTTNSSGSGKPLVAFISNNSHEFWSIAKKGTEAAAKQFDVQVEFKMPPAGTSEDQRRFIEDLQNKGVKAIAISPNDSANQ